MTHFQKKLIKSFAWLCLKWRLSCERHGKLKGYKISFALVEVTRTDCCTQSQHYSLIDINDKSCAALVIRINTYQPEINKNNWGQLRRTTRRCWTKKERKSFGLSKSRHSRLFQDCCWQFMRIPSERYAENFCRSCGELHIWGQEHRTQSIRQPACTHLGKITKAWGSLLRYVG